MLYTEYNIQCTIYSIQHTVSISTEEKMPAYLSEIHVHVHVHVPVHVHVHIHVHVHVYVHVHVPVTGSVQCVNNI